MGYTIQTPEEQGYMDLFMKNDRAIWDHKQRQGGSFEDAFQAVTGKPWMPGRSVKHTYDNGGRFDMTKDRTVKSVLGKYIAAPAAVGLTAAFAPGALPAVGKAFLGAGKALVGGLPGMGGGASTMAGPIGTGFGGAIPGTASTVLAGAGKYAGKQLGNKVIDKFTSPGQPSRSGSPLEQQLMQRAGKRQGW